MFKTSMCSNCRELDMTGSDDRNVYQSSVGEFTGWADGGIPIVRETGQRIDEGEAALGCQCGGDRETVFVLDRTPV